MVVDLAAAPAQRVALEDQAAVRGVLRALAPQHLVKAIGEAAATRPTMRVRAAVQVQSAAQAQPASVALVAQELRHLSLARPLPTLAAAAAARTPPALVGQVAVALVAFLERPSPAAAGAVAMRRLVAVWVVAVDQVL